jgi:hypothetical protein
MLGDLDTCVERLMIWRNLRGVSVVFTVGRWRDQAMAWARRNRALIAHKFLSCIGVAFGEARCVLDVFHNFLEVREFPSLATGQMLYLHRKGAAPSDGESGTRRAPPAGEGLSWGCCGSGVMRCWRCVGGGSGAGCDPWVAGPSELPVHACWGSRSGAGGLLIGTWRRYDDVDTE